MGYRGGRYHRGDEKAEVGLGRREKGKGKGGALGR